eukprot:920857-Prymnesium_polylepis.1
MKTIKRKSGIARAFLTRYRVFACCADARATRCGDSGPFVGRAFHGAGRDRPGRPAASEQLFRPFFRRRRPSRSMY